MREVKDKGGIHIDITNACIFSCTNCYKFVGHYAHPYFMELETVKKAIDSLEGYPGLIVITGGEPALHPDFTEICSYLRKEVPPYQRFLQTTGFGWADNKSVIKKTFGDRVWCNEHKDTTQKHHPMLIAIADVVADDPLKKEMIDKCWVRDIWSAVITPKGCFSCEIAGAFDMLYDGPGGLAIEKGWWEKGNEYFNEQLERYCWRCGAALPLPAVKVESNKDFATRSNFAMLEKLHSPKLRTNRVVLTEEKYSAEEIKKIAETWKPWNHLGQDGEGETIFERYGKPGGILLECRSRLRSRFRRYENLERHIMRLFWRLSRMV